MSQEFAFWHYPHEDTGGAQINGQFPLYDRGHIAEVPDAATRARWAASSKASLILLFDPATPGPIGASVPNTGAFTTLTASGNTELNNFTRFRAPSALGNTAGDSFVHWRVDAQTGNVDWFEVEAVRAASASGWGSADIILRRNIDDTKNQQSIAFRGTGALDLLTGGAVRASCTPTGNWGFGTTDPQALIEARKDAAGANSEVLALTNGGGGAGNGVSFGFRTAGTDQNNAARMATIDDGAFGYDLAFYTKQTGSSAGALTKRLRLTSTTGATGGTGSAGAGNQYVELEIAGSRYKLLHDGVIA